MALYGRLCGVRTDGAERLGVYGPGLRRGTDLRAGSHAGAQAWCEPVRQRGRAGETANVRLTVRNAGDVPTPTTCSHSNQSTRAWTSTRRPSLPVPVDDREVPRKQVAAMSPAAGSWVTEGDTVTLTVHCKPLT